MIKQRVLIVGYGEMGHAKGLDDNVRGYLATVTMQELAAISGQKGGTEAAPYGLAGLTDCDAQQMWQHYLDGTFRNHFQEEDP